MSRVLLAVAIDDWGLGPLAAKEVAVMRLEPLGNVQVLRVKVEALGGKAAPALSGPEARPQEDEQLGFMSDSGTRKDRR